MTTQWFSWACRACLAGWWGPVVPSKCPNCEGHVHITGNGTSTEISRAESLDLREK